MKGKWGVWVIGAVGIVSIVMNICLLTMRKGRETSSNAPLTELVDSATATTATGDLTLAVPLPSAPEAADTTNDTKGDNEGKRLYVKELNYYQYSENLSVYFAVHGSKKNPEISIKAENLQISPELEDMSLKGRHYCWDIEGKFKPGQTYTIVIKAPLRSTDGAVMETDGVFNVKIPPMSPSCRILVQGPFFPSLDEKGEARRVVLPTSLVNVKRLHAKLFRACPENFSRLQGDEWWNAIHEMEEVEDRKFEFSLPKDKKVQRDIDFSPLFAKRGNGVYILRLSNDGNEYPFEELPIILSDMVIQCAVNVTSRQAQVFVRRFSDGKAAPGCAIFLYSTKHRLMGRGVADEHGQALLNFFEDFQDKSDFPCTVVAANAGDATFLRLDGNTECDLSVFEKAEGNGFRNTPYAFLYSERGVCRPGESIGLFAWVRSCEDGALLPYKNAPMLLTVTDPNGKKIFTERVTTDAHGHGRTLLSLPQNARTGQYTVTCDNGDQTSWGTSHFTVAFYVPDRIRVKATSGKTEAMADEATTIDVQADYYFGTPVAEGTCQLRVMSEPMPFPAHWKGYAVGDAESNRDAKEFSTLKKLGADGKVSFQYPGFALQNGVSHVPVMLTAVAEVSEPGGRAVTDTTTVVSFPSTVFLGLAKQKTNMASAMVSLEGRLLGWNPADSIPAGTRTYNLTLFKINWEYVQREEHGKIQNVWERKRTQVPCQPELVMDKPSVEFSSPDLEDGCYELLAESADGLKTRLFFWHSQNESASHSANPSVLTFQLNREHYRPGETAQVTMQAPSEGQCYIVCGGRCIHSAASFDVKAGENVFEVPLPEKIVGDAFHVGVTMVFRNAKKKILRSFGLLQIPVDQSVHELDIALEAPARATPGEDVEVTVLFKNNNGEPLDGEVHLFAVDEGILSLTGFKTPDIYKFFYGRYLCSTEYFDAYSLLFPDVHIGPDGRIGGDGGSLGGRFREEILSKKPAIVLLDILPVSEGKATTRFALPKHLGAMRLMAVGASGLAVGSASSGIILRDKVNVLATAPRAVAPGDEFDLHFKLFNTDEEGAGDYVFTVALPDSLASKAPLQATGQLPKGASRTHTLRCTAGETLGGQEVHFTLKAGNSVFADSVPVTVRGVNPSVTRIHSFRLEAGKELELPAVQEDWHGEPQVTLRFAASPAIGLKDALDWLNSYPYGCLEQTTAGAFPYLALNNLLKAGIISDAEKRTAESRIHNVYMSLLSMRLGSGGFAAWPGGMTEWEEASVFATNFLVQYGKEFLGGLEPELQQSLRRYLIRLGDKNDISRDFRGYVAYVLSFFDDGDMSCANLARRIASEEQTDLGLFLAGAALVRGGYAREGMAHVLHALDGEVWRVQDGMSFEGDTYSAESRLGQVLAILMEIQPDNPLVHRLAMDLQQCQKDNGSAWGTTQANAWGIVAMAAYAAHHGAEKAVGNLTLPNAKQLAIDTDRVMALPLSADGGAIIRNGGEKGFYVQQIIVGMPKKLERVSNGIHLSRRYLDENGKAVSKLAHGQKVNVELRLKTTGAIKNLVLVNLLPGGLEVEDSRLASRKAALPLPKETDGAVFNPMFMEKQDDRFLAFGHVTNSEEKVISFTARAVSRGRFANPPFYAEAMYDPQTQGVFSEETMLTIE